MIVFFFFFRRGELSCIGIDGMYTQTFILLNIHYQLLEGINKVKKDDAIASTWSSCLFMINPNLEWSWKQRGSRQQSHVWKQLQKVLTCVMSYLFMHCFNVST